MFNFKLPRRSTTIAAASMLFILIAFGWFSRAEKNTDMVEQAPDLAVVTTTAEMVESYPRRRSYLGRLEASQISHLGFELGGRVAELFAEEGSVLAAGEPVAQLDTALLEQQLERAAAALEAAHAEQQIASLTLERERETFERQLTSQQALDRVQATANAAVANTRALTAQLGYIKTQLKKSVLRAPFDGAVIKRHIDSGSIVNPGSKVVTFVASGAAEIKVDVPHSAIAALPLGSLQRATINGLEYSARVHAIAPQRNQSTRAVTVILQLDEAIGDLLHGATAELSVEEQVATAVVKLPLHALTESVRGIWAVYVAAPQTGSSEQSLILDRRQVEVVHQSGKDVYVRGGITTGDQVVVAGLQRLVPGQRVHLAKAEGTHE